MSNNLKEHGLSVTISSLAAMIPVLAAGWFILQPLMLQSMSAAMAEDIAEQIDEHAEPMQNAFKIILKLDIDKLKRSIKMLEFREEHQPEGWFAEHAELLADNEIELEGLEAAYDALD